MNPPLPMLQRVGCRLVLLGLFGCVFGCGSKKLATVSGKVTVDGKSITMGKVTFKPNKVKGNASTEEPTGSINDQGEYTLSTRGKPGAPPGWYKVIVPAGVPKNPKDPYSTLRWIVNEKYVFEKTTPLEVEVVADAPAGHYDLKLKR